MLNQRYSHHLRHVPLLGSHVGSMSLRMRRESSAESLIINKIALIKVNPKGEAVTCNFAQKEMASVKVLKRIPSDDTLEDSKKCKKKKKKSKKEKREKLVKNKKRTKGPQGLEDDTGFCESITFTQMPEIKKGKKKKKNEVRLKHEKASLSKQHKQAKKSNQTVYKSVVQFDEQQPMKPTLHESSTLKERVPHKRRVMFNLSPEEILPKSQPLLALRDTFQTQPSSTDKLPSFNPLVSGVGSHRKSLVEENGAESQSTTEDINSQDLFITQKSFSEPCADISSSLSTDEAAAVPPYQNSKQCRMSSQENPSCKQTAEASTQTENFFTSPGLATLLRFHQQSTPSTCVGELMDLSLPNRSRKETGLRQWGGKPDKDQNCPELKTADITSSDESDILSKCKADLSQLKVVQTRLNESFFFKLKGEGDSPKPRSPLMVLTGSTDMKTKSMVP
ncbi:hypothetical protein MHYP_G00116600 [Metynnis hypsauchen]